MQPTRALWRRGPDLLSADATTLAPAALNNHIHLVINNFVPSLDLLLASLTEATFPGYAALDVDVGAQDIYYDAADGLLTIRLLEPAGGWSWVSTGAPGAPETIYGAYLTDNADTTLWGAMLLANPVTIDATGQGVTIGEITLKFATNSPV